MAPLAAAAMESYARAYPHLVRLHMLQELADASALLQVNPRAQTWNPDQDSGCTSHLNSWVCLAVCSRWPPAAISPQALPSTRLESHSAAGCWRLSAGSCRSS